MPTLWSATLIPTARQVPADAEVPSHQLMLRAGLIRKLTAGVYDYLPLGLRALHKVCTIIREEMDAAGAVQLQLPSLQPIELWQRTGRREAYGENLFVVRDRHGREQALGPTHEEVITELVGAYVESYRQLPLCLYQIQTKFRDEFRPRFGVLRTREFLMKDAYSFHLDLDCLSRTYDKQYAAYRRIFERCGLTYEIVEAESGPIGGSASHEFMVPSPTGEDTILKSDKGNYAANVEKCGIGPRKVSRRMVDLGNVSAEVAIADDQCTADPLGELETVATPDCPGIEDVIAFFKKTLKAKLKTRNMIKTLVCACEDRYAVAVLRGDHELNEAKLRSVLAGADVQLADQDQARRDGFAIGFVGPQVAVGRDDLQLVVDPDAAIDQFWVTGANQVDHHVKLFHWGRDVIEPLGDAAKDRIKIADIRNAVDGDPSPKNDGGVLRETKGIEIGHVFKLGDKYTRALDVTVSNEENTAVHPLMGCYGIGVNRILAAAIERPGGHDEQGIIWPASIAPYQVIITPIKYDGRAKEVALSLADELEKLGCDVLIDDRDERPGVKFKDADLVGLPVRITLGDKALDQNCVELKARSQPKAELVPIEQAAAKCQAILGRGSH